MRDVVIAVVVGLACMVLGLALAGCASEPVSMSPHATCTVPYTRDAGMGVRVDGCAVWQIGDVSKPATRAWKPWWQN